MKIECISISSSDAELSDIEDDHCTDYNSLCRRSWVQCEFCDEAFNSRFSLIQHNASHIIIPLIKQTHQCTVCLHHFTCEEDLNLHVSEEHRVPDLSISKLECIQNKIDILKSIVEQEVFVQCEDELKEVLVQHKELSNSNTQIIGKLIKKESSPDLIVKRESLDREPVRNRLLFENDDDNLNLLKDITTDCRVDILSFEQSINTLDNPINTLDNSINTLDNPINSFDNPMNGFCTEFTNFILKTRPEIEIGKQTERNEKNEELEKGEEQKTNVIYTKAIHYDELLEPKESACQYCGKYFPNRFQLYKHEPKHMTTRRFRQTLCGFCEKYIAGNYHNLRRHIDNAHPDKNHKKFQYHRCKRCQLIYFNYTKHFNLYHPTHICEKCHCGFRNEQLLDNHDCLSEISKVLNKNEENGVSETFSTSESMRASVMKLCDLCFSFMKIYIQNRLNYLFLGEHSELGVRQTCHKCNNKFFAVKLVQRRRLAKETYKRAKPLSNKDRLKRVQSRLKMMQNRNKF